jgi:hypothetical protein
MQSSIGLMSGMWNAWRHLFPASSTTAVRSGHPSRLSTLCPPAGSVPDSVMTRKTGRIIPRDHGLATEWALPAGLGQNRIIHGG